MCRFVNTAGTLALWKAVSQAVTCCQQIGKRVHILNAKCVLKNRLETEFLIISLSHPNSSLLLPSPLTISPLGQQHVRNQVQVQSTLPQPECWASRSSPSGAVRGGSHPRQGELSHAGPASSRHHHCRARPATAAGHHSTRCSPERFHRQPRSCPRQWKWLQGPGHHLWSGAAQSRGVSGIISALFKEINDVGQCNKTQELRFTVGYSKC